jgi:hypothetical protein
MFDHLCEGRFILGVSPGALVSDAEAIGILEEDRNKMFAEAIDVILAIWERNAPYDIEFPGNRFKVTTRKTMDLDFGVGVMPKPYQKPRPEIVGTVVAPFSKGVVAMGERDFHPLSANFLLPHWLKTHWANYAEGKQKAGISIRSIGVAGRAQRSSSPTTTRWPPPTAATTPTVPTASTTSSSRPSSRRRAPRGVQGAPRPARPGDHLRVRARPPLHPRHRQQGGRPASRIARAGRRLRRAGLRRHGLGGQEARPALDGADGHRGNAAGQRRDSQGGKRAG